MNTKNFNSRAHYWTTGEELLLRKLYAIVGPTALRGTYLPHLTINMINNKARKEGVKVPPAVRQAVAKAASRRRVHACKEKTAETPEMKLLRLLFLTIPAPHHLVGTRYYGQ